LDEFPATFYLLYYGPLVWNRAKLAFVPGAAAFGSKAEGAATPEEMEELMFTDRDELVVQLDELNAMGVEAVGRKYNTMEGKK
jgi:hypothetical protein